MEPNFSGFERLPGSLTDECWAVLCLCRSGRFFDGVNFVHYLDAAVVLWLASGVVIATRDVERRTTLPLPVTASLARTVTQYSQ
jgi:hypothetical protein